jgi:hypothetical protein
MAYDNHLEEDMKEGPLFFTPIDGYQSNIWYKRGSRVGQQTISQMLKNMAEEAGVEGKVTNKTSRRTAITRMSVANVPREVMCLITGHKNPNSLDRYDDLLEVAREAAMRTLEAGADGVPRSEVQYSNLKNQVSQLYLEHQAVKLPSLVVASTSEPVIHNIEPEIAIHPSVPENFYNRQNTAALAPSFQSGVSLESTPCVGSASRQEHGYDRINQVPGPSRCVGGCIIHCFPGPSSATGPINPQPRDHDSGKFKGAPNPYGNRRKHGQVYRSVPPQFAKSPGQI